MANPRVVQMQKIKENQRLDKQFASLATPAGGYNRGGSPNTYSQMRTPEGGPNRGGSPNTYSQMRTPEGGSNRSGSGKPKYTRSTVFDDSGETLEETNVDENDVKTTTKVFTPATYLEQAATAMREEELGYPAGPPNAYDMLSMQEQERFDAINAERRDKEENAAALGATVQELYPSFNGPSIAQVPSPHLGEIEMNGQLSSSMLLANGSNNGRGKNKPNEKMVWSERLGRYITMDEYLGVADQFPSAPSDKKAIYNSDLQEWVLETTPALSENDVGVLGVTDDEAYSAQTALAAELEADYLLGMRTRHPEKFVEIMNNPESYEAKYGDPHSGEFPIVPVKENEEEEEIENKIKDEISDEKKEDKVIEAVKIIKEEDPTGIALTTLNDFATYADTVTNKEAVASAKQYLQELKDSPTVTSRFRKAMAIGMLAMLFGDDFTTAMNTGFGVVADDYEKEETEAAAKASAEAALQKTIATEKRAAAEWDRRTVIDAQIAYNKELRATNGTRNKESLAAQQKISSDNFSYIQDRADKYWKGLSDKAKDKFKNVNDFQIQMDQAMDWMTRNWTGQVDFGNSTNQRVAFENAFSVWMQEKQMFDTAGFQTYIQDAFIKQKFTDDATYIEPSLISPDRNTLIEEGKYSQTKATRARKSVAALYTKLNDQIIPIVGNEKHALMLLKKDFNDFKINQPDRYEKLLKASNKVGEGVFTRFVNQLPANSKWGMLYDADAKGKTDQELLTAIKLYIKNN